MAEAQLTRRFEPGAGQPVFASIGLGYSVLIVSDYEWMVQLAAKGLREHDNHPMPPSVTTAEAFYEVMAGAALDGIDLRALLERLARAEQELETIKEQLRQAEAKAEKARRVRRIDPHRPSGGEWSRGLDDDPQ